MLRIIGGTARGIRIKAPDTLKTRPTQDAVKESVFNILMPYIEGTRVLDLFAGSGSLGMEAISRGASEAVFVDNSRVCRRIIEENLKKTRFSEQSRIITMDIFKALNNLKGQSFDIIFMDPPYNLNFIVKTLKLLENFDIIKQNGIVVCEHHEDEAVPDALGRLVKARTKEYGDTIVTFYVDTRDSN